MERNRLAEVRLKIDSFKRERIAAHETGEDVDSGLVGGFFPEVDVYVASINEQIELMRERPEKES